MMSATERRKRRISRPINIEQNVVYNELTNDQLAEILRTKLPHMAFLGVTDENRQTIIAMLEITEGR